jgi:transposase
MKGTSQAMIDQIRRLHAEGHKIKKIARVLGKSKNTVKKHLRDVIIETMDGENSQIKAPSSIDWKYAQEQVALGRPVKRVYEDMTPTMSYSHFARELRCRNNKISTVIAVRQQHEPGEKAQVDYCDGLLIFDAKTMSSAKSQFFCGVLPASSYVFGEFTASQKSADFIRSHERMWNYFGGVAKYVVLDNLKSGVTKAHRYDPDVNPVYCDFANHCGFAALPARVRTPRDKACVEATIGVIQRDFFERHRNHKFYSLVELNIAFRAYLDELNRRVMSDYGVSRSDRFALERPLLGALPASTYELYEWKDAKVHPDCCIELMTSVYSVPHIHVGKKVKVKFNDKMVIILDETAMETLAVHPRREKHKPSIVEEHLPPHKTQRSCFDVKRIERFAASIGSKTTDYVTWQFEAEKYPLRVLRRMQGLVRFFETNSVSKEAMEFAALRALSFKKKELRYFTDCARHYKQGKENLHVVNPPKRELANIHLQSQEF